MINPRNILYAGLPVAASLLLGGCLFPTSEKTDTASAPDKPALAASVAVGWSLKTGLATSIGAGFSRSVYITGTDTHSGGWHTVYKWSGSDWIATAGGGFETDVGGCCGPNSGGEAVYVIGSDHRVYKSNDRGSHWSGVGSLTVSEIGTSTNGYAWALGTDYVSGSTSDHPIYKWDDPSGQWIRTTGGGVRIDVDPSGYPYVINSFHDIWKGDLNGVFAPFTSQKANDIGISSSGNGSTIWIIGNNPVGSQGDFGIIKWDGTTWQEANGGAVRITVDYDGTPWIVNSWGNIYQGA
ncbi:MAG: hypothetical protein JF616_00320 [Fibrobacteres bacterium]|nr:hypothetical protein [Fibrobacterota bacterium]